MPKVPGGHSQTTNKCWNETYTPHKITIGGLAAVLKASAWQSRDKNKKGWNGAAILARIEYMRRAMNVGLIRNDCLIRAQKTIANLEAQL